MIVHLMIVANTIGHWLPMLPTKNWQPEPSPTCPSLCDLPWSCGMLGDWMAQKEQSRALSCHAVAWSVLTSRRMWKTSAYINHHTECWLVALDHTEAWISRIICVTLYGLKILPLKCGMSCISRLSFPCAKRGKYENNNEFDKYMKFWFCADVT